MTIFEKYKLKPANAICYSGFRAGQQPGGKYPTYEEIREDLLLLQHDFKYLRIYDVDLHAEILLEVISKENFNFKIMLGAYIEAEMNNENCPWEMPYLSKEVLEENKRKNESKIQKLIVLANKYPQIINFLSVGNEACVSWTDHLVSVESVINYTKLVKNNAQQPVTFCENYLPWLNELEPLVEIVDFISIHTYPLWENIRIEDALNFTIQNYNVVKNKYPHKNIVITEAGWATAANGRGFPAHNANENAQQDYFNALINWCKEENILCYYFEAFDEQWKGSADPLEPEKHWGLFKENRKPKKVMFSNENSKLSYV
ncbi:Exo-beta-1,3-glucanase, GH17 family [Halpernia humi]|uniref:Endo-1,3-beta-glucanase btgC n=1 Tax=Halpernia humi TaxID=493375 RepID=A0A1H5U8L6_9FLAO|nr:glycosyl hydrolase family 17 protein [Halpernia humi]SEF71374.1 Exo-beta-1,3-glucanase, GH17 family [Halpernia humi]